MSVLLSAEAVAARDALVRFLRPRLAPDEIKKASKLIGAYVAAVVVARPPRSEMVELADVFFNGRRPR